MKSIARILALCLGAALSMGASAQDYPNKPITLIIPFGAGGNNDVSGRIMAQKIGEILGQPVVVENRTGAAGAIGATAVARARPDGYTLGYLSSGPLATNVHLYKSFPYDPMKDFAPIARVSISPGMLVVQPSFPATTLRDFIAHARQNPGKVSYAHAGKGSWPHMAGVLFESMASVELLGVAYRGGAQQVGDILGGQVLASFNPTLEVLQHVQSGKLRALGVSTSARLPMFPDVPAIAEVLPGYEISTWNGVLAPTGTPPDIIRKVNAATRQALADPVVQQKLSQLGLESAGSTPEEFGQYIRTQIDFFGRLVKIAGIQPE
ncbi:Bug family tripartite tricarboxylate transporter substrate binding protein [Hydrogenophaga sp.]|uniref:Bug family tripartite tricarboxylate transporter substrate binding protein n=1 Tax=Hydrogenophaga sp. TaxID=1904254 RepID=UPI003F6EB112